MNTNKVSLQTLYKAAKETKVGQETKCPSCGTKFVKTNYQQAFCKSKGGTICKDNYWNNVTPSKRNNTTRISPANALYMEKVAERNGFPDVETMRNHVDETDEFSVHVENCEWCGMRPEYCRCD